MKIKSHVMHVMFIVTLLVLALGLTAGAPLQTEPPPDAPTPEVGQPPIAPPEDEAPNYAGFIASVGLVLTATAFVKERLKINGRWTLITAFLIVALIGYYPDILARLPQESTPYIDKFVYGVLLPFIGTTGSYDFAVQIGLIKPKPKTNGKE